jgi:hypothetical protein
MAVAGACLCSLWLAGCAGMGPGTVPRDRFDYINAISDSWKRQMLLNLLKVRYTDAPVFLDVASVINSYSMEGEFSLGGEYAPVGRGDSFTGVSATGKYVDSPTITYAPLRGDSFARSLMAPIPTSGILHLMQSGYPADLVLRVCVSTINGLENAYGGVGNPRAGDPKFFELMADLRTVQTAGGMGMRMKAVGDKQTLVLFLRPATDEAVAVPSRRIRELLGLNAEAREFTVTYGAYPANDTEIVLLSRSMLQIMVDLASYIDVPPADAAEGRVYVPSRGPEELRLAPPLLKINQGEAAPQDAYAAVRYRNHWFWIDDRDVRTKGMFNFLMFMFTLTETGNTQVQAPVVTIPAR